MQFETYIWFILGKNPNSDNPLPSSALLMSFTISCLISTENRTTSTRTFMVVGILFHFQFGPLIVWKLFNDDIYFSGYIFDYHDTFSLKFDHIQGDPYASPSRICVKLPLQKVWLTNLKSFPLYSSFLNFLFYLKLNSVYFQSRFPSGSWSSKTRKVALADYICRKTVETIAGCKADHKES